MAVGGVRDWRWLLLPSAIAFAFLAEVRPTLAISVTLLALLTGLGLTWSERVPTLWGWALGVSLLGYAVLGRGFAYLGLPPLFVGEALLATGTLVAFTHGRWQPAARSPFTWLILAFIAWGAAQTVPYLGVHGLSTLRDAVIWGYAVFALIIATLLSSSASVREVVRAYRHAAPWVLVLAPAGLIAAHVIGPIIPNVPGTEVAILDPKPGDLAVHLVGIFGFMALGLHRRTSLHSDSTARIEEAWTWLWGALWMGAWLTTFTARAAILTGVVGCAAIIALHPRSGWWRPAYVGTLLLVASVTFDVSVELGDRRAISAESLAITAVSLFDTVERSDYGGTRTWRLNWWNDIVDYTIFGAYRWTGKGYGINLANDDGYQVHRDDSLRSPHNAHLNVLARSGVPGLLLWAVLHLSLLGALLHAYLRRRAEGRHGWARLDLWLLAYALAFHVNASFDVYLEGPQGGIWFWALVGFALAVLRLQERPSHQDDPAMSEA